MGGEGSVDEKLAPHDFVADFVWAARAVIQRPSVALVSIAAWSLPTLLFRIAGRNNNFVAGLLGFVLFLFAIGWLGVERKFFREQREGKKVAFGELFASAPFYIGRFLRLGLLAGIAMLPMMVVTVRFARTDDPALAAAVRNATAIATMVAIDLALTFVTSALAFTTRSAREALRIGLRMIRQTWPRSGLYVLCPALALNMLSAMYPSQHPVATVVRTAAFTVLALVAKGATAAFYLRERPVSTGVNAHVE